MIRGRSAVNERVGRVEGEEAQGAGASQLAFLAGK